MRDAGRMFIENPITSLIDELGAIRGQIRELKSREAELRRAILDLRPNGEVSAEHFSLRITEQTRKRFDPSFLPDHVRDDSRFWSVTQCKTLVTKPRPVACAATEDELEVIERF